MGLIVARELVNRIEPVILDLLSERGEGKTICPSEAARRMAALDGHPERWRAWLNPARAAALAMAKRGSLAVSQSGVRVDPDTVRGAIRLSLPRPLRR